MTTPSTRRATLTARTRAVETPVDILDAFVLDGFAFLDGETAIVARGVAATVVPAEAAQVLRDIDHDAPPDAPAVIAVGALPFAGPGELVIPAVSLRVDGHGRAWVTEVGSPADAPVVLTDAEPTHFVVRSFTEPERWNAQVRQVLAAIAAGTVTKAVLAREVVVEANAPFDLRAVLQRLRTTQGGCFVYADRGFVGASPELLVRRVGRTVESSPMAGTVPRGANTADDDAGVTALTVSDKDAREHRVVVDAVANALAPHCTDLVVPERPEVVRLPTVAHLVTHVRGTLADQASALDLACALHPTPAVNGTPSPAAAALITEIEGFDRGKYAGAVGWVDATGDGTFAVALRCAQVQGGTAQLYAGAGIVAGSDPHTEWVETQAKLEPMLRALVRP